MSLVLPKYNHSCVVADLPNAGMCNLLLIWAKAYVFSELNNMPLYVLGWNRIRLGPWLRRENSKRYYGKYFKRNTCHLKYYFIRHVNKRLIIEEPELRKLNVAKSQIYVFKEVPNKIDYFKDLREHRLLVKSGFFDMIKKKYKISSTSTSKVIGVHIRRGDFKIVKSSITPASYFINVINKVRSHVSATVPVTVVSDGSSRELSEVLEMTNVSLFQSGDDLVDLLTLSQCDIIIPSKGSTYSLWASFISEADIILPSNHENGRIRLDTENELLGIFEGSISQFQSRVGTVI